MFSFDRLIQAVDSIAEAAEPESFFAQIGEGTYLPRHMPYARMLSRRDFMDKLKAADLLVAHAGMGSVISAMEVGTPIVMLPRRAAMGEVNTDHQLATARWLEGRPGLHVCFEDDRLKATIDAAMAQRQAGGIMNRTAPPEFIDKLRQFIATA